MSIRSRSISTAVALLLLVSTTACGSEEKVEDDLAAAPLHSPDTTEEAVQPSKQTTELSSQQSPKQRSDQPITVQGTFTLSHNDLFPVTGRSEYLNVVLVRGTYYEDWNPGPFMGSNWTGDFELQWMDEQGTQLASLDLTDYYSEKMVFGSFFQLSFGDYNGDGAPDFTLGQYGTNNSNFYELFTLLPDHRIEQLPVEEGNELLISEGGNRYSVPLEMEDGQSFRALHYNNATGKYVKQLFKWDGTRFEKSAISDVIESGDES